MSGVRLSCAVLLYTLLTLPLDVSLLKVSSAAKGPKIVCYYDSKSFWRKDVVRVSARELKPALNSCTHLVYGYAGFQDFDEYRVNSMDPQLDIDMDGGESNFRHITSLKSEFPHLKILLSIGGGADLIQPSKYLDVLNEPYLRTEFASSLSTMAKRYGFHGVDLAWQFPEIPEKKAKYSWGYVVQRVSKMVGYCKDSKEAEYKEQFTALVREVKGVLNANNCSYLSVSILPHVNATAYFDLPVLQQYVDHFTVMVYDLQTPERSPKMADYASPLQPMELLDDDGLVRPNIMWLVDRILENGLDRSKMVLGIPTYGRTWELDEGDISGNPPLAAKGPGSAGTYTEHKGLLAYYEICPYLVHNNMRAVYSLTMFNRIQDPNHSFGTYTYRLANSHSKGIWVSFEEPETAKQKAEYVKQNNYGGLALMDISLDDARGLCDVNNKYPILKAVKAVFSEVPKTESEAPKTEPEAPKPESKTPKTEPEAPKIEPDAANINWIAPKN